MYDEKSFENFFSSLEEKARENPFPLSCTLELTYKCNLRCQHCYLAPMEPYFKERDLQTGEVFSILEQLREMGCLQLTLTGGEIFLRKDLFEILQKAKSLGLFVALFSNATMITPEIAERLSTFTPIAMEVSLYGMKKETYERVTQIRGSYERFFEGIRHLKERGVRLKLKMPIMTLNLEDVEAARSFAYELGVPFQSDLYMTPRWNGSRSPLRLRIPTREAARRRTEHLEHMPDGENQARFWTDRPCEREDALFNCRCGKSSAVINPKGWMRLCIDIQKPKADALSIGVKGAWEYLVEAVRSMKPTEDFECPACPVSKFCTRSPGQAFVETGAFDRCLPYHKEVAQETEKRLHELVSLHPK